MTRIKTFSKDECKTLTGYYENPERFAGNFATKQTGPAGVELIELSDWDKNNFDYIPLKENEQLFRMTSDTMRLTGQRPLVKINVERGLVYYLDQEEVDKAKFETRGVKATYINLVK